MCPNADVCTAVGGSIGLGCFGNRDAFLLPPHRPTPLKQQKAGESIAVNKHETNCKRIKEGGFFDYHVRPQEWQIS